MSSDSSEQRRHHSDPAASHYTRWPSSSLGAPAVVIQLLQYNSFSSRLFSAYTDDMLCDVIGCYGYDVYSAAAAAQGANDKDVTAG